MIRPIPLGTNASRRQHPARPARSPATIARRKLPRPDQIRSSACRAATPLPGRVVKSSRHRPEHVLLSPYGPEPISCLGRRTSGRQFGSVDTPSSANAHEPAVLGRRSRRVARRHRRQGAGCVNTPESRRSHPLSKERFRGSCPRRSQTGSCTWPPRQSAPDQHAPRQRPAPSLQRQPSGVTAPHPRRPPCGPWPGRCALGRSHRR